MCDWWMITEFWGSSICSKRLHEAVARSLCRHHGSSYFWSVIDDEKCDHTWFCNCFYVSFTEKTADENKLDNLMIHFCLDLKLRLNTRCNIHLNFHLNMIICNCTCKLSALNKNQFLFELSSHDQNKIASPSIMYNSVSETENIPSDI